MAIAFADLQKLLLQLLAEPSVTGQEGSCIQLIRTWLQTLGKHVEVDYWRESMQVLQHDPAFPGREIERDEIPLVAARIVGKNAGPKVMLVGHVDVAPVADVQQWNTNPFSPHIVGDLVTCRGAVGMKGGLVAALAAFQAFAKAGADFSGELLLVVVSGDLDGGCGSLAAIRRGYTADYAILPAPTSTGSIVAEKKLRGPSIAIAQSGFIRLSMTVEGRAAHACAQSNGISALDKFLHLFGFIKQAEKELNEKEPHPLLSSLTCPYPTLLGRLHAGAWTSSVMDKLVADIRVAVALGETTSQTKQRFLKVVEDAIQEDEWLTLHPPSIVPSGNGVCSASVDAEHPVVATVLASAVKVFGSKPDLVATANSTAMSIWAHTAHTPTIQYGPGNVHQLNSCNETVCLAEVHGVSYVLLDAIAALLKNEAVVSQLLVPSEGFIAKHSQIVSARAATNCSPTNSGNTASQQSSTPSSGLQSNAATATAAQKSESKPTQLQPEQVSKESWLTALLRDISHI